jgi:hypothetical protein
MISLRSSDHHSFSFFTFRLYFPLTEAGIGGPAYFQ